MPNRVPPRATTAMVTAAWMFIVLPTRIGCITLPSSCWTTSTIASTPTAVQMPLETSATRTATDPATNAPTIGTNPPKKVSTAMGRANGTPSNHTPTPMKTPSTAATAACDQTYWPRAVHTRSDSSAKWVPAARPIQVRSHGTNLGPSLRKKKHSTRARTRVITAEPMADRLPSTTPSTSWLLLWISEMPLSSSPPSASGPRLNGGPASQLCRVVRPAVARSTSSPACEVTWGASTAINPLKITSRPIRATIAARALGSLRRMNRTGGHRMVASSRPSRIGRTTLQSWPRIQNAANNPTPMISRRSVHCEYSTSPCSNRRAEAVLTGPVGR